MSVGRNDQWGKRPFDFPFKRKGKKGKKKMASNFLRVKKGEGRKESAAQGEKKGGK